MTEEEFIRHFESGKVGAESFHHADHVRLAFAYLSCHPLLGAVEKFSRALRGFAAANGKPDLYHETITYAYVFLIHERMARQEVTGEGADWERFAGLNPDLLVWKDGVLCRYYCEGTLRGELSKRIFLLPDKMIDSASGREGQSF